ncbi:MAG: 16S rRNA (cytidine(1402)-2'-O)-methyltransferase [Candidatus Marinimicrobia bacterium]|nr:16S rRNA (cytidine(1402)-2'-O)-methyltransferase [Candidatus Neomarinimicrobiota bacterium]RPG05983.1 MAG: 16S rRNA (cytidine(1402)-2'-O)-methyltransferase [Pelagibacteraceae bacterium TMED247]|tara:strand:- start:2833 stop:3675 length:843 start_codon:yes stop_codon:yes gene_type:complete
MSDFLPGLYIVSTPIGNLEDITLRALNVLKNSDQILCEDTRRSIKLLNHYAIKKKLVSNHRFNEKKILDSVINFIKEGKRVSIISDAGTPILSDPGLILIRECIKKNISVFPIPGVSAITTAMSVSGFDDKYFFYGFLPKKDKELQKVCNELKDYNFNIVFFIPAIKINFYIKYFKKFFIERNIFIAREMTKIHETFYRLNLETFEGLEKSVKGEITIVLSKKNKKKDPNEIILDKDKLSKEIARYLKIYTLKDVVKLISEKNDLPKKEVYQLCLKIKKK